MTFSPQNINLKIPVSKTAAPRNIKQPYMIILLKKKTPDLSKSNKDNKEDTQKTKTPIKIPYWYRIQQIMCIYKSFLTLICARGVFNPPPLPCWFSLTQK